MKIPNIFRSRMFYVRLLTAALLLMSVIPFCNPITSYDTDPKGPLVLIMKDIGSVIRYFSTEIPQFFAYSTTLFVMCIVLYIGLVGLLFGFLLTFSKDYAYKLHGLNAILYSSAVMAIVFVVLCFLYFNINITMYKLASVAVYRKLLIVFRMPLFLIIFTLFSAALFILSVRLHGFSFSMLRYKITSLFSGRFKGGVHVPYHKVTRDKAIEKLPPSPIMVFPLSQHIGAACESLVKPGDYVTVGQKIGDTEAFMSAPVHSSVSGKVLKVDSFAHPTQNKAPAIIIENDFLDKECETLLNTNPDYMSLTNEQLISIIREAGITGMGGASFPTHVKIQSALKDNIDTLIINAAECEPYLSNDNRMMLEATTEMVEGIKILCKIFSLKSAYIGIETNKPKAIKALSRATHKTGIKVVDLHAKYPQGGEKQLIKAVCNREVPSGKLPSSVGCSVFNVETVSAIYRAVVLGIPVIRRTVTVAGTGVERPSNLNVRLGTPFKAVLEHCGYKEETKEVIMGGPMMGASQYTLDVPVIKGTSGILCFTEDEIDNTPETACIRCGSCVSGCPMNLTPNYIAMYAKRRDFDMCESLNIADCIECGCCSYTCPAHIPLLQYMRLSKQNVIEKRKKEGKK